MGVTENENPTALDLSVAKNVAAETASVLPVSKGK